MATRRAKDSLTVKYDKWEDLAKTIDAREIGEQLQMAMGKPLTEEEFKALQARKGGGKPTIVNAERPPR